ncbi:MAG TPA: ATP-binding cassette domain-containing protein [Vicinamibacterales bacterium]|nr:ATP-binding cassette domain-containing protein [Vicinamibacterales bacterium]
MSAIEIRDVTKQFDKVVAVNQLTLSVPTGSIYGFIGPNGSGKTTTIRMIMNILVPDSGQIQVLERSSASEVRDQVGYLPEERGLYKRMTVRQVLRYYGQLKGRSIAQLDPMIKKWLDRLQLGDWADKKVLALSKGMSQKVQFISTIVAEPKLLILDEPFSGLDPVNADSLRDAVLDLRRQGVTVVFSTHDMTAAEKLCDRIFMIFKGNKVLDGSLDEIQARYGQDTVRVRTGMGAAALAGMAEVDSYIDIGNLQDVKVKSDAQAFLRALSQKTPVFHFELKQPSLHDIFVRIARPTAEEMKPPPGAVQ